MPMKFSSCFACHRVNATFPGVMQRTAARDKSLLIEWLTLRKEIRSDGYMECCFANREALCWILAIWLMMALVRCVSLRTPLGLWRHHPQVCVDSKLTKQDNWGSRLKGLCKFRTYRSCWDFTNISLLRRGW